MQDVLEKAKLRRCYQAQSLPGLREEWAVCRQSAGFGGSENTLGYRGVSTTRVSNMVAYSAGLILLRKDTGANHIENKNFIFSSL